MGAADAAAVGDVSGRLILPGKEIRRMSIEIDNFLREDYNKTK